MRCEICGTVIKGKAYKVIVDRSELIVCWRCANRVGSIIEVIDLSSPRRKLNKKTYSYKPVRSKKTNIVEEIVEDYSERIKEARNKIGITRDVLAAMVGEKVSTIRRIEEGMLQPTIGLARKLEKVLKIKLVERYEEEEYDHYSYSQSKYDITLGDVVEFKGGD